MGTKEKRKINFNAIPMLNGMFFKSVNERGETDTVICVNGSVTDKDYLSVTGLMVNGKSAILDGQMNIAMKEPDERRMRPGLPVEESSYVIYDNIFEITREEAHAFIDKFIKEMQNKMK